MLCCKLHIFSDVSLLLIKLTLSCVFTKLIRRPSGLNIQLIMYKFSDKTDKSLLNYSYLFWGPLFIGTQCISITAALCLRLLSTRTVSRKTLKLLYSRHSRSSDRNLALVTVGYFSVPVFSSELLSISWNILLVKLRAWTTKSENKINKLEIHQQKLHNVCIITGGTAVKISPQNF